MSDKDIPSSGSRWEPADDAAGATVPQPEVPPTPDACRPAPGGEPTRTASRRAAAGARWRPRAWAWSWPAGSAASRSVTRSPARGLRPGHRDRRRPGRGPGRTAGRRPRRTARTSVATAPVPASRPTDRPGSRRPGGRRRRHGVSVMTAPYRAAQPAPAAPRCTGTGGTRRCAWARCVLLWASLLLVTYWWVTGGGVQDLAAWDTGLTSRRPADRAARLRPAARAGAAHGPRAGPRAAPSGRTGWPGTTASSASPRST